MEEEITWEFEDLLKREFIGHGEAAVVLQVHPNTLRSWVDNMEKLRVHCLIRNLNNERIYKEIDLRIFKFIRDQRMTHGARRVTSKELAVMVQAKFECRTNFAEILGEDEKVKVEHESGYPMEFLDIDEFQETMLSIKEALSGMNEVAAGINTIQQTVQQSNQKMDSLEERLRKLESSQAPTNTDNKLSQLEHMGFIQRLVFAFTGKLS